MADDWSKPEKTSFYFYETKFNIVQKHDEGSSIVCINKTTAVNEVLCAKEFASIWFVVQGDVSCKMKMTATHKTRLRDATDAYNKIVKNVWDSLNGDV